MLGEASCAGCQFLTAIDSGYSNYTVTDTDAYCLKNANPALPAPMPYDWEFNEGKDNWPATQNNRCELYKPIPFAYDDYPVHGNFAEMYHADVEGETQPSSLWWMTEEVSALIKNGVD